MTLEYWLLAAFCLVSGGLNGFLAYRLRTSRRSTRKLDISAQDLLHDLTRKGSAILKVDVIDAENLLLRSPRR